MTQNKQPRESCRDGEKKSRDENRGFLLQEPIRRSIFAMLPDRPGPA
ncbi:hypothetical protein IPU70_07410 [Achromobacter sp. SD115]|nr:hypothetical protein [Achromobacter sp. SD115]MBO1013369.1 hypothetical protein [Achromobacter sp. SD115]